jgi:hypothetical protein
MRSLFEKEEKETALNQLRVDLLSRFYPFSNDEVIKYKSILNFDRYHLMNNDSIIWDTEMLESLDDKIDWSAIWKNFTPFSSKHLLMRGNAIRFSFKLLIFGIE